MLASAAPPSWPWRRAALLLAGDAQLITISALVSADLIPMTWSSLLLAIAPALLAAGRRSRRLRFNLLAAVTGIGSWWLVSSGRSPRPGCFSSRPWWCSLSGGQAVARARAHRGTRRRPRTRYLTRDWAAIAAVLLAPLASAAILLPFRSSWPNTNVAVLLVVGVAVSQLTAYARRLKVVAITDAGYRV